MSICVFEQIGEDLYCCIYCGDTTPNPILRRCDKVPVARPGDELAGILASIGIAEITDCPCKPHVVQMNAWGVEGCREHLEQIVGWLREGESQFNWAAKLRAGALAVANGLAVKINPLDPFPGIVEEAIRRAEAKATTSP